MSTFTFAYILHGEFHVDTPHSAVNEISLGAVQSYSILNGTLSGPIGTVETEGNGPAFCAKLSNGIVAAMNYGSGNGTFLPTSNDGKTFVPPVSGITFPPPSNGVSHPHMALEYNGEVFVSDLVSSPVIQVLDGFLIG